MKHLRAFLCYLRGHKREYYLVHGITHTRCKCCKCEPSAEPAEPSDDDDSFIASDDDMDVESVAERLRSQLKSLCEIGACDGDSSESDDLD